ncbi:MAG: undecaprenyl-diphosphatase, partial [Candidatus Omnitrophica bacterium CG_4_9_14_0_2_um_filter_42_8]
MTFLQAVISGIVQGVAEFLPISSSGHLVILHKLMGTGEPELLFDLFLHLGTLAAIFI